MGIPVVMPMLATLGGVLALACGLAVLLLPLLLPELSRPRDAVWGAVVLLLGLVLVTSADRLTGSPMLGVLCSGLLIGRLGLEVGQGRWRLLSEEEQLRLRSTERWQSALQQLRATTAGLLALARTRLLVLTDWLRERRQPRTPTKRWVRPEPPVADPRAAAGAGGSPPDQGDADPAAAAAPTPAAIVSTFAEIDALIEAAAGAAPDEAG